MRKKRIFAALMALWLCCLSSAALAAAFPDLACFLNEPCRLYRERYQFSQDFLCDAYVWEYPAGWDTDNDVAFALLAQWSPRLGMGKGHGGGVRRHFADRPHGRAGVPDFRI